MKTVPEMLKSLTKGTEGITSIQESVSFNSAVTRITFVDLNPPDKAMSLKVYHQAHALEGRLRELGIDSYVSSNNAEASVCINQANYGQVQEAYKAHLVHSVTTFLGLASLTGHGI